MVQLLVAFRIYRRCWYACLLGVALGGLTLGWLFGHIGEGFMGGALLGLADLFLATYELQEVAYAPQRKLLLAELRREIVLLLALGMGIQGAMLLLHLPW